MKEVFSPTPLHPLYFPCLRVLFLPIPNPYPQYPLPLLNIKKALPLIIFDSQDNRAKNKLFQGENFTRAQQALEKLCPFAERHNCTLAQLALAWLIAQPQTQAIASARYPQQAKENAQAAVIELSETELPEIDAIGRILTDYLDDDSLMWNW